MGLDDQFFLFDYLSDDDNTYSVKLSQNIADAGGFTASSTRGDAYPHHNKNLRHVWLKSDTGKRTRLPVATTASALWTTGGTVNIGFEVYSTEGFKGERRDKRNT